MVRIARQVAAAPSARPGADRTDAGPPDPPEGDGAATATVVQAWLASRGLIALVALLLAVNQGRTVTDMVSNWDVQHFTRLAVGGYFAEPDRILMAFFPGFPGLLRLFLELGVPVAVSGVLLSAGCSAVAAAALVRLGGRWAAVGWLFAPVAVFTMVPYTESLFCALAFWAWERARSDRWGSAAMLAAGACTVRVSGLFLVGALVVMVLTGRSVAVGERARRLGCLVLPAAVLALYATYLHWLTGSWTAWYTAQSTGWERELTWPWESLQHTLPAAAPGAFPDHPWWAAVFRAEIVSMALGLVVTGWCVGRRLWAEASWVGVQVLAFSLSYWFFSVNRATLLWFPLWMMLAHWGTWRPERRGVRIAHRAVVAAALVASALLMMGWSWLFFTGHWAS